MHWRAKEFSETLTDADWLSESDARVVYDRVTPLMSRDHYGLEATAVRDLQRIPADAAATDWLSSRIPQDESLLLIFGSREVCRVPAWAFHEHWQDLFCPSRDDVVIISERGGWILFYCHEDEFEYGEPMA
ncbi:hypothetical protein [Prosthecobacter sp.]|uniref:hypothetical protein n=1 Tax=Prosthecobacter sp. TaxID=1965333 RepID=UPI001D51E608|nr:hypothetical protein [Prosthecobacter sp.]MCB1277714.1 hypothetical protein [Prosthecobacter sp.]